MQGIFSANFDSTRLFIASKVKSGFALELFRNCIIKFESVF